MEQYIKNIIPNIQKYGKKLSQKEYFVNKTWLLVNNDNNFIQYTFKKNYELIISLNGDVIKGKWEILTQNKILIDSTNGTVQLENLFLNQDIIVLLKPSINEELLILINEDVIRDRNPLTYLQELQIKKERQIKENSNMTYDRADYNRFLIGASILALVVLFSAIFDKCNR